MIFMTCGISCSVREQVIRKHPAVNRKNLILAMAVSMINKWAGECALTFCASVGVSNWLDSRSCVANFYGI